MKILMVKRQQAGFTLIELILGMAITSALVIGVFAAQKGLRDRTQFDTSVNLVTASMAAALNEAQSGVNLNTTQRGRGENRCPSGPAATNTFPYQQYVYAGVEWVIRPGSPLVRLRHWKALENSGVACVYETTNQQVPGNLSVTAPSAQGGRVLFIRTSTGSMRVCAVNDQTTNVQPFFAGGSCTAPPVTFRLTGANGSALNITVDESGLARRN